MKRMIDEEAFNEVLSRLAALEKKGIFTHSILFKTSDVECYLYLVSTDSTPLTSWSAVNEAAAPDNDHTLKMTDDNGEIVLSIGMDDSGVLWYRTITFAGTPDAPASTSSYETDVVVQDAEITDEVIPQ